MLGALLALLVLGGAGPAAAHAALRSADPADGSVLKSAPHSVTLTFTESVGLLDDSFRLFSPDGRRVPTQGARHAPGRGDTARVGFPAGLGEGTFIVAWRVVSADSHPVSGAFTFSVGRPTAAPPAVDTGPDEDPVTGSLYDLARYAAYGAVALLVGTAAFVLVCRPPELGPLRRPLVAGWWALLVSTLVLLVLRAPYETGGGPESALDPSGLSRTLTGRPGLVLLARLALLPLVALHLVRLSRNGRAARPTRTALATGAALALALALTWAAADHASAGVQVPAAMASTVLHLLAMAVWLGGLTALLTTLNHATPTDARTVPDTPVTSDAPADADDAADPEDRAVPDAPAASGVRATTGGPAPSGSPAALGAVAARFSRTAFAAVAVLVVTGVYQSWRGLGSWSALTGTTYGRLLLLKTAAVVLLLAVASRSRHWTARSAAEVGARTGADAAVRERARARERVPAPAGGPALPPAGPPAPEPLPDPRLRGLRRSVLAEVAVGVLVLVVTTVLTGTLPGRAATEAARSAPAAAGGPTASVTMIPFTVGTPGGHGTVQVTLEPGRVGQNSVEAVVYGPDGGLATVPELRLSLTLPARGIGPVDAHLTDKGGYWGTDTLTLPIAGTWIMKATVRVSDVDQVSETRRVRITG
ncbi:copper resistance CopC/CopD family protein [Streptomyces tropicalis]|uniref:copper resistance CopC family protein n=1 Tax=Streptomyces tropicalis TaxID=3034234 RepID=UPI003F68B7C5